MAVVSRPDLRWKRCDVKSTNLLANVVALESANRAGAYEALLVDAEGLVTEATHSSVLWVRDGRLEGTPNDSAILPGTTRFLTQKLAADAGHPVRRGADHASTSSSGSTRRSWPGPRSRSCRSSRSTAGRSATAGPGRSPGSSRRPIRSAVDALAGAPGDLA